MKLLKISDLIKFQALNIIKNNRPIFPLQIPPKSDLQTKPLTHKKTPPPSRPTLLIQLQYLFSFDENTFTVSLSPLVTEADNIIHILTEAEREAFRQSQWDSYLADYTSIRLSFVPPIACGDVNGDGNVNGADVTALYECLLNNITPKGNADVNNDGNINGTDVTSLYNILLQ